MRFIAAVLALMAIFAGVVRADEQTSIIAQVRVSIGADGKVTINSSNEPGVHSEILQDPTLNANHKKMNVQSTKKMGAKADDYQTDYLEFPWTRFHVADAFAAWKLKYITTCYLEGPNSECEQNITPGDGITAHYYGSQTKFLDAASLNAAIGGPDLFKLNSNIDGSAIGLLNSGIKGQNGNLPQPYVISPHTGWSEGNYWPASNNAIANPILKAQSRFSYIYVQIIAGADGINQGDLAVSVAGTPAPPNTVQGDPQFVGLQGQDFQFHGMADEIFSLVSSPELQMNSLFKFISSGKCDYNDTMCWSHPGTYLGQIGVQFGNDKILLQSGAHAEGMKVFINDKEVTPSRHIHQFSARANLTAIAQFRQTNKFSFNSDRFFLNIVNSDYFFNLEFGLKDSQALVAGSKQLAINGEVCERESRMHRELLTETKAQITAKLAATYPTYPLHGLVGQTWRNAVYCGRYYEGTVDDYVTGTLFGGDHTFNYFQY